MADDGVGKLPSYDGLIKAIKKSGKEDQKMADKQWKAAKEWYKDAEALNKDIVADLQEVMEFSLTSAKTDRAFYESIFQPLIEEQAGEIDEFQQRAVSFDAEVAKLKQDAEAWGSEANQKYMAGKAQAGVSQAFAASKADTERALLDMGVNPNSGMSRSLVSGTNLAEGASLAAAGTTAADATRAEADTKYQAALDREIQAGALAEAGLVQQANLVNVGQTYPGQIATATGQVGTAGAQAIDSTTSILNAETAAKTLAAQYQSLNETNLSTWTNALTSSAQNQISAYQAETERESVEAQESSGLGSALGVGASVLTSFLPGFKRGGAVEQRYADGGAVNDPNLSDTGGATGGYTPTGVNAAASGSDNVAARLTPGEFVVPKHVVDWYGQKHFQDLIAKADKSKPQAIAKTGAAARPVPGALTI